MSSKTPRVKNQRRILKNTTNANRVFSYVIEHDVGFAPNPFHGHCTLAACKPQIRQQAEVGDLILGFASIKYRARGKLIYWMRVGEIIKFEDYWIDPRFQNKKPVVNGSLLNFYGDNIYEKLPDESFKQSFSFHSKENGELSVNDLKRDTDRTEKVLIADQFCFYGKSAVDLPDRFSKFVNKYRALKSIFPTSDIQQLTTYLLGGNHRGVQGRPNGWK